MQGGRVSGWENSDLSALLCHFLRHLAGHGLQHLHSQHKWRLEVMVKAGGGVK